MADGDAAGKPRPGDRTAGGRETDGGDDEVAAGEGALDAHAMSDLATETSSAFTDAQAINDRGQIVGANPVAGGHTHAVVVQDGFVTDLGSLGGDSSAVDINERGMAVGTSSDASGTEHAVLWTATGSGSS